MNSGTRPSQSGQLLIGEARINILRALAIFVLYLQHAISFFAIRDPTLTASFHTAVNFIVLAWVLVVGMVFFMLQQKRWPIRLSWFILFCDAFLISWLVIVAGGAGKIQPILFLLLIGTSPLRLMRPLVWFAVCVSIAGYLIGLGHYAFVQVGFQKYYSDEGAALRISRHDEIFFLLTLIVAGVVADQIVLQAYRIARSLSSTTNEEG